jgi:hypothetical protein
MTIVVYVIAAAFVFWVGMILTASGIGGLPFLIVAAVIAGLKLADIFPWSWWWAMLPVWGAVSGAYLKMRLAARDPRF